MAETGENPEEIVEKKGLKQVTDTSAIEAIIDTVIAANPDNVASYKAGKVNLMGWFVGQVMKQSQGKANPAMVNKLLKEKLGQLIFFQKNIKCLQNFRYKNKGVKAKNTLINIDISFIHLYFVKTTLYIVIAM